LTSTGNEEAGGTGQPVLLVERRENVMVLTLNRPEARNAINLELALALGDALERADEDPEIRAVVLTGAGDRAFCAGADLKARARGETSRPSDPVRAAWGFACYVRHPISKPTIAAVNGFALGGGTEISLASDLVIAADTATFGLPEVQRGLYAAAGGAFRLPKQIPTKIAMEMILTGEPISAHRAYEIGLVNVVVPADQLLSTSMAMAERIAANAPLAVQASKRVALGISDNHIPDEDRWWDSSNAEGRVVLGSADATEGPRAFSERRLPVWRSR
jgi:crotonobetainyl-CoA hydratase